MEGEEAGGQHPRSSASCQRSHRSWPQCGEPAWPVRGGSRARLPEPLAILVVEGQRRRWLLGVLEGTALPGFICLGHQNLDFKNQVAPTQPSPRSEQVKCPFYAHLMKTTRIYHRGTSRCSATRRVHGLFHKRWDIVYKCNVEPDGSPRQGVLRKWGCILSLLSCSQLAEA